MNYGNTAYTCLLVPCSKSRFQFLQQHSQKLCLHVLDGTMQQEQIPIAPGVIISMISAACSNSHNGCNFFQLVVVFHVDNERPICDARSVGVPGCASNLLSTFFYHSSPFSVKSCSIHNIIWLHNRYTIMTKDTRQ